MSNLEKLLADRVGGDARAHVGAVEFANGKPVILFGALGNLPRLVIAVDGDALRLVQPNLDAPQPEMVEAKPVDPAPEVSAVPILGASKIIPDDYTKDELIAWATDIEAEDWKPSDTKPVIAAAIDRKRGAI